MCPTKVEMFIYVAIAFAFEVLCSCTVQSSVLSAQTDRTFSVECNTTGNSTSCNVIDAIGLDADSELIFMNVPNVSEIVRLKLVATQNASHIPLEIFETFVNLQSLELAIGLKRLELKNSKRLKQLLLIENRVDRISAGVFVNATDLIEINLQKNQISEIEDTAFNGLDNLTMLNLHQNKLTTLKRGLFSGALNLKNLDLSFNEIEIIEPGAFALPKLEEILINNNHIKLLSDDLFIGAPNIQNLDLRKNHLETIGKALFNARRLNQLQLSDNENLRDLDILSFAEHSRLIYLGAEGTSLRYITNDKRTNVTNSPLLTLSLSRNQLFEMDFLKTVSIFPKLEKIYIDSNRFIQWNDDDVSNVKIYFPNIDLIVTKNNVWDRVWAANVLIPTLKSNNIFCNQFKYLGIYIFGFRKGANQQVIEGTECV